MGLDAAYASHIVESEREREREIDKGATDVDSSGCAEEER